MTFNTNGLLLIILDVYDSTFRVYRIVQEEFWGVSFWSLSSYLNGLLYTMGKLIVQEVRPNLTLINCIGHEIENLESRCCTFQFCIRLHVHNNKILPHILEMICVNIVPTFEQIRTMVYGPTKTIIYCGKVQKIPHYFGIHNCLSDILQPLRNTFDLQ